MSPKDYETLISDYLGGRIPFDSFELTFNGYFDAEPEVMDEDLYHVVDSVDGAIKCYWPDVAPENESTLRIGPDRLRTELRDAMAKLAQLISAEPNAP